MTVQEFGRELFAARRRRGWNKATLAANCGVSMQTVGKWESSNPPTCAQPTRVRPTVIALARGAHLDVDHCLELCGLGPLTPEERIVAAVAVDAWDQLLALRPVLPAHAGPLLLQVAKIMLGGASDTLAEAKDGSEVGMVRTHFRPGVAARIRAASRRP